MRRTGKRRSNKSKTYVNLMNFRCSNPDCKHGYNVEGHHIIPLSKGGIDAFWNIISLCRRCHRGLGLHHNWQSVDVELYTWKCFHELNRFGFNLDEKEQDFREKLKKAVLMAHSEELHQEVDELFPIGLENTTQMSGDGVKQPEQPLNGRD